ncbi:hypothetical protein PROFUN_16598 [Planoprotostelium fungivorum]|uniref:Uncharacterized protein n=1 Tax=Planoprotostelium fungivorum TaxID=1890364 RepID=A0A2P6MPJ0_9EUKA|nr:hypothetical protein PROFUN_16598 [Planoprotostelium fungivorum]
MTTPSRPRNDLYLKGLKTTNDKRDVLAADVRRLTDEEANGAAKMATFAWITTASDIELDGCLTLSKEAFIDAVKAKGPTTADGDREAIIRQGAANHPWVYSPTIARACGPVLLEPWQQSSAHLTAGVTVALITRRAVWLRRFTQYKGDDHDILNEFHTLHMTTPSRPRNDLYLKGLKTTNDKRDVLAADVTKLPTQQADGAAKAATLTWIETASERELNGWLSFSDQEFIDAVKAKGPTTADGDREAIIRQGAANHPWVYSPTIARACGPVLLEPWQQSSAHLTAGVTVALITRRAVWLRRFTQYKGDDHDILNEFHTRLNLPSTTKPQDALNKLYTWKRASTYGLAGYSVWLFTAITTSPKIQKASQKLKVFWHGQGSK